MYPETELLMLSGLQHVLFCERQWALIHLEQQWEDNRLTALGDLFHDNVHSAKVEKRGNIRLARTLRLVSFTLGFVGQADIVEFHKCDNNELGVRLKNCSGLWSPFPVEYKHGKPKKDKSDEVQLCAQAICLEEMLNVKILDGALFYGKNMRRYAVSFNEPLRELTVAVARRVHELFENGVTPPAKFDARCKACSLLDICMPNKVSPGRVKNYLEQMTRGV